VVFLTYMCVPCDIGRKKAAGRGDSREIYSNDDDFDKIPWIKRKL